MKVLVVGGGGREHAVIKKIAENSKVDKIFCAPGNAGIAELAQCIDIAATDVKAMVDFAKKQSIDLCVVTPDDPLALGMVDELNAAGIKAFGPNKDAAIIEASKVFSKDLMKKYNIPTAKYEIFQESSSAIEYLKNQTFPIVIKADGLALGKGVIIANNYEEACQAVNEIMEDRVFGSAGNKVVIEEFLTGTEVSVLSFTDGTTLVPMVSSQDHKKAYDNDLGPNTGGMGAFAPSPIYTKELSEECMRRIFLPTINAMNSEGRKFKGVLYFGLIITEDGPKVIEYNCRFGDPESQVVLPLLKTDLIDIFYAVIDENLSNINIEWYTNKAAVCVVMASGGYPKKYVKGYEISGIKDAMANDNIYIYHSGTKFDKDMNILTSGGRVLGVTAVSDGLLDARNDAYNAVDKVHFTDAHFRKDIGERI